MKTDAPALLLLGGANPNTGLMCISQARSRGLKIWLTDTEENLALSPTIVAAADHAAPLSYRDRDACVAWSLAQARKSSFVGVYSYREFAVEAVAAVSEALGLPGNSLQDVVRVRNKLTCRQALQTNGFRQPAVAMCTSLLEAQAFIAAHPIGPWVMKPPAAMGSAGVSIIHTISDLERAIDYLTESCNALADNFRQHGIIEESLRQAAKGPFLIECFQRGEEYSAEGVFVYGQPHVLVATAKRTFGPPNFVEVGHAMPAELDPEVWRTVKKTVESALLALNLRWGQFHVEFWLDNDQPVLGEVHVRPGGDFIHYMTQYVTGLELYGVLFDQMLGRPIDITKYQHQRGAAIRFLTPPPGRVTAINGWEKVITDPHCLLAELALKVGDQLGSVYSSSDRHAFILANGVTAQDAERHVERLNSLVRIEIPNEV